MIKNEPHFPDFQLLLQKHTSNNSIPNDYMTLHFMVLNASQHYVNNPSFAHGLSETAQHEFTNIAIFQSYKPYTNPLSHCKNLREVLILTHSTPTT